MHRLPLRHPSVSSRDHTRSSTNIFCAEPQWPYTGRKYGSAFMAHPMQGMPMPGFDDDPSSPQSGPPMPMAGMPPNFSPYAYRFAVSSTTLLARMSSPTTSPVCHPSRCRGKCNPIPCSPLAQVTLTFLAVSLLVHSICKAVPHSPTACQCTSKMECLVRGRT